MSKKVTLKDRSELLIRALKRDDLDRFQAFFQDLPQRDRAYLRRDVARPEVAKELVREIRRGKARRLVAVEGERIVALGVLEREGHGWKEHVGELRLIVARSHQRKGLGMLMARELYTLAAGDQVQELVVKMMRPQLAARKIFRRLGFHREVLLPEYVTDLRGRKQDLIVMRCDLKGLWEELEHYFAHSDWQRTR